MRKNTLDWHQRLCVFFRVLENKPCAGRIFKKMGCAYENFLLSCGFLMVARLNFFKFLHAAEAEILPGEFCEHRLRGFLS